jgi:exopolysaccharide biosynthesis polyprenyl glycosylphosphotransferase
MAVAPRVVGPLAAAIVAFVAVPPVGVRAAALVFVALALGLAIADRRPEWQHLLPMMGKVVRLGGPALGFGILIALRALEALPEVDVVTALWLSAVSTAVWALSGRLLRRALFGHRVVRVAVIGSARASDSLRRELQLAGLHSYDVVGRIALPDQPHEPDGEVRMLGTLNRLGPAVERHRVDLLLMSTSAPRMAVFDEMTRSCLHTQVRLRELSSFYEETFGHVPVAEINAAWFQYILHPRYRAEETIGNRCLDIVVATLAGVFALPLLGVLALLIKRDGGPVFFRQERIGEGGRPFTIFKLRTMTSGASSEWSSAADHRVTPIGRLLRRTHLDELPQVLNVLRGEMSIVGPRPEQPSFVDQLEQVIPFYQRRHLIKPGLTGWAQVRCGYAGSEVGSAWKVCHDLYYLKNRSVWMNLVILGETLRTLVADPQYTAQPSSVEFILAPTPVPVEPATA